MICDHSNVHKKYTKSVCDSLLSVSKSHIHSYHPPHGSKRTQLSGVIAHPLGLFYFLIQLTCDAFGERP